MDIATFNRFRRTGVTKTTQALEDLFTARPDDVVEALNTAPFRGLPPLFEGALRELGLTGEDIKHIREWPDEYKERVRVAVLDAIRGGQTVRFAWKLHEASQEDTTVRPDGPDAIRITFYSPWDNVRALGRDDVCVDATPPTK